MKTLNRFILVVAACLLVGCATTQPDPEPITPHTHEPNAFWDSPAWGWLGHDWDFNSNQFFHK
jgi:hypothetical protein